MGQAVDALVHFTGEGDTGGAYAVPGFPDNRLSAVPCRIADAREVGALALDEQGFELARHDTAFADVREYRALQGYCTEMAAFLHSYLGAALVVPARTGLCRRESGRRVARFDVASGPGYVDDRAPADFAHVDYVWPEQVAGYAAMEAADAGHDVSPYSRLVLVQTWRAVSPPPQDMPLALCDRRTFDEADVTPRTGILPPQNNHADEGIAYQFGGVRHNPGQRWHYFPAMGPGEVLLFTGLDTARPNAGRTPHAAFASGAAGAIERVSLEARFYAWFG
jgi:hypothetical protein